MASLTRVTLPVNGFETSMLRGGKGPAHFSRLVIDFVEGLAP